MFLPESPRWLYSQGRVAEAEAVLTHIITRNNGHPPKQPIKLKPIGEISINVGSSSNEYEKRPSKHSKRGSGSDRSDSFTDLVRVPVLRSITLNNMYTWFANCCVYYGLTVGLGKLGGSLYVSVALSGVVELPAYLLAAYMIDSRLGRRYTYSWTMLLGGTVCMSIITIPAGNTMLRSAAALLGKMAISLSFSVAWLYSAEMYPTSLRNQGVSVCSGSSRVGGMIAPLIMEIGQKHAYMDFMTYGVITVIAGLLALRLPETHKQDMPENVQDLLRLHEARLVSEGNKPSSKRTDSSNNGDGLLGELNEDKVRLLQEEIEDKENEEVA